jgi:hypothetical protein
MVRIISKNAGRKSLACIQFSQNVKEHHEKYPHQTSGTLFIRAISIVLPEFCHR